MRAHGGRLALVTWPLDAALALARYVVLPALLLVVGTPMLPTLARPLGLELPGWLALLTAGAASLLYLAVIRMPELSDSINRVLSQARRRVRLACGDASMSAVHEHKFACRLVPGHLRAPLFQYDRQRAIVSMLRDSAIEAREGDFWVIEGPSGSGKTRTAHLLADTLIRHPSEFGLAEKVRYFDLVAGEGADVDAVRALASSRLDGTITILDNFHRVGRPAIESLTDLLLDSAGAQTRLLVLLARPTETWKLSPGADVRIVSEARRRGRHLELEGAPGLPVRRALASVDEGLAAQIRELSAGDVASPAQLHLSRFAAANAGAPERVARVVGLLAARGKDSEDRHMAAFLGVVAALSMHRGFFSRSQFARAARLVAGSLAGWSRLASRWRLRATLQRMRRMGLVPWVRAGRGRYVFHEAVAELAIERLLDNPPFAEAFATVGTDRLRNDVHADPDVGWMIAAEVGADAELEERFDAAMLSGAFFSMARTLERAANRREIPYNTRLQLGLLYDRIGEFARAREVIDQSDLAETGDRRVAEHLVARIEASHDDEARAATATLEQSQDALVAAAGRYWGLHMGAHAGSFAPDRLSELCEEMRPLVNPSDRFAVFVLARAHFDHMRHLYLSGRATAQTIAAAADSEVGRILRDTLPTFDAMSLLYTQAHLCAHVVLPRLALERGRATPHEAELLGVDTSSLASVDQAAELALKFYRRARDEFWQYGDREARYLDGDVVNAELMVASPELLDSAESKLHSYEDFIRESGFADLASLPHVYLFRYHCLRYFDGLLERGQSWRTPDEHLAEARRHIREAVALDDASGNVYGRLRADLLGLFLDAAQQPFRAAAAHALSARAERGDYVGMSRVLDVAASFGQLTNTEVRALLRFTPVVHQ